MSKVDDAEERWARAKDAWSTVTWVLARDPTVGAPLAERGHLRSLVYEGSSAHELPAIFVLYEIDEHYVTIVDIQFSHARTTGGHA